MTRSDWDGLANVTGLEDEYEIIAELGRGGSAIVYRARDRALNRDVAIKMVRAIGAHSNEEQIARLAREARTVAQLEHPRIVTVHAVKPLPDGLALIMQWIPGRTLKQRILEEGPLPVALAMSLLRDIASALAYAHSRGIVHRDVKPENIFLDAQKGHAMLSDFGIAVSLHAEARLTMTGTTIGTPTYMAPELLDGGQPTARSDVYALGLVAWEMLTGQQPWAGDTLYGVIYRQKHDQLPSIDAFRNDVPERMQYVVERALQKRAAARWAGGDGFLAQLEGGVLPADWPVWRAAHDARRSRRVAAALSAASPHTTGASGTVPATTGPPAVDRPSTTQATRRFRRDDAPSDMEPDADTTAADGAVEIDQDDETPDWLLASQRADALEANREPRVHRTIWPLAIAMALVLAVAVGVYGGLLQGPNVRTSPRSAQLSPDDPKVQVVGLMPEIATRVTTDSANVLLDDSTSSRVLTAWPSEIDARPLAPLPPPPPRTVRTRTQAPNATTSRAAIAEADTPAIESDTPARALSIVNATARIAVGGRHSCVIIGLRVSCWGANEDGQRGSGSDDTESAPTIVASELPFVSVSAGTSHSCGVVRGGAAYCWGNDEAGQLGDATTTSRTAPVRVATSLPFALVRTGRDHSCGLTSTGTVACWGRNHRGQLGDGGVVGRASPVMVSTAVRFVSLAVGAAHSCAISADGALYCWGANDTGQLGDGTTTTRALPTIIASSLRFVDVAAGTAHSCAVSVAQDVWCWGRVFETASSTPSRMPGVTAIRNVTAGAVHSCARSSAGIAWCWGRNSYGQLGNGTTADSRAPVRVSTDRRFDQIVASGAHTCALAGRDVWCWGYNADGQVGGATSAMHTRPVRVDGITGGTP